MDTNNDTREGNVVELMPHEQEMRVEQEQQPQPDSANKDTISEFFILEDGDQNPEMIEVYVEYDASEALAQEPGTQTLTEVEPLAAEPVDDSHGVETDLNENNPRIVHDNGAQINYSTDNGCEVPGSGSMEVENDVNNSSSLASLTPIFVESVPQVPRVKQKRKEPIVLRPYCDDDMELKFISHDPVPLSEDSELKKRPRKEYKTKKKAKLSTERSVDDEHDTGTTQPIEKPPQRERETRGRKPDSTKKEKDRDKEKVVEIKREPKEDREDDEHTDKEIIETRRRRESTRETSSKKETPRRELPKRGSSVKDKVVDAQSTLSSPQRPQTERRTRISNSCRVALGKSYKCNDCDFSTDRINNIIAHVKDTCPKRKKISEGDAT